MVSINVVFWLFIFLFAVVGASRGWAKEMLVSFSVILALFILTVLEVYVPFIYDLVTPENPVALEIGAARAQFWIRSSVVVLMAFFGYQTPNLQRLSGARFARERLQDTMLGLFLGALNGYLIIGTLWFFLASANYPFPSIIAPIEGDPFTGAAWELVRWLPPRWLGIPTIYFAVAIAFAFVVIVFI
jgi:hypothetical protein